MTKELTLVNSILTTTIDEKHYERLSKFEWHLLVTKTSKAIYRYIYNASFQVRISIANEIYGTTGKLYDHKNRNQLDNTELNLRRCTRKQNNYNKVKRNGKTSIYVGVYFCKRDKVFYSNIIYDGGKKKFLGRFDNEIDAAKAYNTAAKIYHGEFASLNPV